MSISLVERLKNSLAHNLHQLICVASGNVAGRRRPEHVRDYFAVAPPNFDFVSGLDGMSGLGRPAVKQNKTRVAKLLSDGAARAKAAQFQEEIKTHWKRMKDEG
jgi:hypothetical protein